ncbi:trypsin-like serine peptidase [Streptomyces clavuligerus]|uniref:trypsin-like serine peptidase n=1 Tax=Streptomyces clavuligerus TaxID=1901 RepID=UPI001E540BD1|nr:hypothetical protein [Streptomyces clavuligerus]WDN56948.1 hypothetical protein LL058_34690 [Streptomyces clavuligerus]
MSFPAIAVLALAIGLSGSASATPADVGRPDSGPTVLSSPALLDDGTAVDSAADGKRLAEYWTPERMAAALPPHVPDPTTALRAGKAPGPDGEPSAVAPLETPASAAKGSGTPEGPTAEPRIPQSSKTGRVFYRDPIRGTSHACTASMVNSGSRQLVLTAGHCVHTGPVNGRPGAFMTHWTYVPGFRSGQRPYGVFWAKRMTTFASWASHGDVGRDVAFVVTELVNGRKLGDVTGGWGIAFNQPKSMNYMLNGYPSNHGGGNVQQYCGIVVSAQHPSDPSRIYVACAWAEGASGSPFLAAFNQQTLMGYANGVQTQWGCCQYAISPYFDNGVMQLYRSVADVT